MNILIMKKGAANMVRKIALDEEKKLEYEILKDVVSFCEKQGIRYYLADGTLIGAIRHQGFIPWDDDIDIEMPRPDFERFALLYNSQNSNKDYHFLYPTDPVSIYSFGKIIDTRTVKKELGNSDECDTTGVDIDIFPIDGAAEEYANYNKQRKKIHQLYKIHRILSSGQNKSIPHKIRHKMYSMLFNKEKCLNKAIELAKSNSFDSSKYIARYGIYSLGYRVERKCYDNVVSTKFEDDFFNIPIGYDTILRLQYGDYMLMPPLEHQVTHHKNNVYWRI